MRISRKALEQGWVWSTVAGLIVFAILMALDLRLKAASGVSTGDLAGLDSALQYRLAFHAWAPQRLAARAGFDLGFSYLLMPLYAASFFCSGVLAAERFTPGRHPLRRWVMLAAMVAPVAALLDAAEKSLQFVMLFSGPSDSFARICSSLASAKSMMVTVGVVLFLGALVARFERRKAGK